MAICHTCGNNYDKTFTLKTFDNRTFEFDCFECAIWAMAPSCAHCSCKIIGHGVEQDGQFYCCAHCARTEGATGLQDHIDSQS